MPTEHVIPVGPAFTATITYRRKQRRYGPKYLGHKITFWSSLPVSSTGLQQAGLPITSCLSTRVFSSKLIRGVGMNRQCFHTFVVVTLFALMSIRAKPQPLLPLNSPGPATFSLLTDREPVVSLNGQWRFHPGDDLHWADPGF